MIKPNSDYPHGLKDKEIEDGIKYFYNEMYKSKTNINKVLLFTPMIQLGQNELQSRHTKRITRLSLGIGILSLLIAALALYVSSYSSKSSTRWESKQIELLDSIKQDINSNANKLNEHLKNEFSITNSRISEKKDTNVPGINKKRKTSANQVLKRDG